MNSPSASVDSPATQERKAPPAANPPSLSRRVRFSVRTLLMLFLLLSLPLGWVAHQRRVAFQTRAAISEIRERGGLLHFWAKVYPEPLHQLLGSPPNLAIIEFPEPCNFTDADLQWLTRLPRVPGLSLHNTAVTEEAFPLLSHIAELKRLDLRGTPFDDASIEHLQEIDGLQGLDLRDTAITDRGMKEIAKITSLITLHVASPGVTDDGVLELAGHPRLEMLNLSDSQVTDRGIAVGALLPELRNIYFARTAVTDAGLRALRDAPRLEVLSFNGTQITDQWTSILKPNVSVRPYGKNESEPYAEVVFRDHY